MPPNSKFPKPASRQDPYRVYRFRVKWDGKYVAGFAKVSALERTTPVIRAGGAPSAPWRVPGQSDHAPITLERGVTYDSAFEQWASTLWNPRDATIGGPQSGPGNRDGPLKDLRRDITLEVYDEAGRKAAAYNIHRCRPSEFAALPDLDANANAVAIQKLTLQHEGWERDTTQERKP
ncbi:MAG TPA: phage tail protein [Allosphingosinicella sp.]|nr:phage tail protein [Allosphingosinicella sp.]